jgi:DnaD/phage-associated family protein
MIEYSILPLKITDKEAFLESTAEEMRVLLALIELEGKIESEDELAAITKTSKARACAALRFWQESGVISEGPQGVRITDEFEERLIAGEITERPSLEVAKSIRDNNLADMINECTALMGRADLSTTDVKKLAALYEQYKLSADYIVTLAAYLAEKDKLSVTTLVNYATKLADKEIDTTEALESYMSDKNSENESTHAFRKLFGFYERSLSKTEKALFTKWSREFGFSYEIVEEAYDIAAKNTNRFHVAYVDRLLCRWHECGCTTLLECRNQYEADKAERALKYEEQKTQKKEPKSQKKKERYGDFDVENAFLRALDRSYSEESEKPSKT